MTRPHHYHIHDAEGLDTAAWPVRTDDLVTPIDRFFTRSHGPAAGHAGRHLERQGLNNNAWHRVVVQAE